MSIGIAQCLLLAQTQTQPLLLLLLHMRCPVLCRAGLVTASFCQQLVKPYWGGTYSECLGGAQLYHSALSAVQAQQPCSVLGSRCP